MLPLFIFGGPAMASQQVVCPHCQGAVLIDSTSAGGSVSCPHCRRPFVLATPSPDIPSVHVSPGAPTSRARYSPSKRQPLVPLVAVCVVVLLAVGGVAAFVLTREGTENQATKRQPVKGMKVAAPDRTVSMPTAGKSEGIGDSEVLSRFGLSLHACKQLYRAMVLAEKRHGEGTELTRLVQEELCKPYSISRNQALDICIYLDQKKIPFPEADKDEEEYFRIIDKAAQARIDLHKSDKEWKDLLEKVKQ